MTSIKRTSVQSELLSALGYEIYRATAALMFLLEGMESVRQFRPAPLNPTDDDGRFPTGPARIYPLPSEIDLALVLEGPGFRPAELLGREAEAEQLAYRGWLQRVASLGEPQEPSARRVLAEIRWIHDDLVHNQGIATAERSGACSVLTWFRAGEPTRLGLRHVLDLLNQLGLMSPTPALDRTGPAAGWTLLPFPQESPHDGPAPAIVSLRVSSRAPNQPQNGGETIDPILCVVFANGVYFELPERRSAALEREQRTESPGIDECGNLRLADGYVVTRETLYRAALNALSSAAPAHARLDLPGWTHRVE